MDYPHLWGLTKIILASTFAALIICNEPTFIFIAHYPDFHRM